MLFIQYFGIILLTKMIQLDWIAETSVQKSCQIFNYVITRYVLVT